MKIIVLDHDEMRRVRMESSERAKTLSVEEIYDQMKSQNPDRPEFQDKEKWCQISRDLSKYFKTRSCSKAGDFDSKS